MLENIKYFRITLCKISSVFILLATLFSCASIIGPSVWDAKEYSIGTITRYQRNDAIPWTYISFKFSVDNEEIEIVREVKQNVFRIYYPEGAMFKIVYDPNNPTKHRCLYFNKPVFNENIVFNTTRAKVFYVSKSTISHGCGVYGGLVLNYEYFVDGKKYLATSAFDLDKVSHLFGDKMRHLRKGFLDNYFEVKYDVDNPALSRLVLDGVEK